ncbi:hypothetical protein Snoj_59180 [Streptomyces nojiriensis]|uniref:Uncharacterized protein n=1 Tax=Streptomyces nojiriensis TaxID=66374 RepID=A0ABQ3SW59_9ACTN|nr:DUF6303 family protein [Streptomyces nojiriensis]QTI45536.1 hypothetical protein JYK04_03329 [Streptomyces nojiriensis]GGR96598.1 hypothetical protein GCM10010205_26720 [Streptomyces nojiriensis]GHI72000.1 hypothetical protein Snoj_59180 [Streptomyces nojiriensis]
MSKQIFGAQMSLRCCGTTAPELTAGPCWQLYVAMTGLVSEWPTYTWPASTEIPTVRQRRDALTELGYGLAEDAEWEWEECTGPDYHPHPVRVLLLGTVKVRPLEAGAA